MHIAIIGAGNMGGAIARGLLAKESFSAETLIMSDISVENLKAIQFINNKVTVLHDNQAAATKADMIIVAVKPWLVDTVLSEIKHSLSSDKIVISIAAGVDFDFINSKLGPDVAKFRVMPNTAISISESMTLVASQNASKEQEKIVLDLFSMLGEAYLIEEKMMSAATSVASCGTAYALRYLRAATKGAVELGFRPDLAARIVAQTMKGAAELILQNNSHPEVEIDKVTTPGGWTIKGLNEMEAHGFTNAVIKGLKANL